MNKWREKKTAYTKTPLMYTKCRGIMELEKQHLETTKVIINSSTIHQ